MSIYPLQMPQISAARQLNLRRITLTGYVLYLLGLFSFLPSLMALVLNYAALRDSFGSPYHSHLRWQLRTFWWSSVWQGLALVMAVAAISGATWLRDLLGQHVNASGTGLVLIVAVLAMLALSWLWCAYRLLRGLFICMDARRMRV